MVAPSLTLPRIAGEGTGADVKIGGLEALILPEQKD